MEHPVIKESASLGLLMLASAAVSAAPVSLEVCSGSNCWSLDNYQILDGVIVDLKEVQNMPGGDGGGGSSVNTWGTDILSISEWSLSMDSDPFVTNNLTFTNSSGSNQDFSVTTTLGITPAIPNGLMRGTFGVSVTDNNGDGATLSTTNTGAPIYQALIDGNDARSLADSPTSFTATSGGQTATSNFSFGVLDPREVAPESIDTNIGITITFSLTPGDSAALTSNFDVVPVPVPPAVWLFGSGLLGLVGIARRRRS